MRIPSAPVVCNGFHLDLDDIVIGHIDRSRVENDTGRTQADGSAVVVVEGWLASRSPISDVAFSASSGGFERVDRPDVRGVFPHYRDILGFVARVPTTALTMGVVAVSVSTESRNLPLMLAIPDGSATPSDIKARKHERIRPFLRCPMCRETLQHGGNAQLRCVACESLYSETERSYDFLPESLRRAHGVVDTVNVSENRYDSTARSIIANFQHGLILDCGAGFRKDSYPNVINLEIADYPSTDVLGVNERLPFADETFDAVVSLAVLEHVRDPFRSASEICRVLRKGGLVYGVVPFLQPRHGYPNHYYNMTSEGLRNLFEPAIEVVTAECPKSGLPIWSLTWILQNWVDGLSGAAREAFLNQRVRDLIARTRKLSREELRDPARSGPQFTARKHYNASGL